jgi:rubrerythrin
MALEKLDKFITNHPADQFVVLGPTGVFQSKEFGNLKEEVQKLIVALTKQFKNAENEFMSEQFLSQISIASPKKDPKGDKKASGEKTQAELEADKYFKDNWYCSECTFLNEKNTTNQCTACNQVGRKSP